MYHGVDWGDTEWTDHGSRLPVSKFPFWTMGSGAAQDVGAELGLAELDTAELAMEDATSELVVMDVPLVVTVITVVSVVL